MNADYHPWCFEANCVCWAIAKGSGWVGVSRLKILLFHDTEFATALARIKLFVGLELNGAAFQKKVRDKGQSNAKTNLGAFPRGGQSHPISRCSHSNVMRKDPGTQVSLKILYNKIV